MPVDATLLSFTKDILGFMQTEGDNVIPPLVLAAEQYLLGAGVVEPILPDNPTAEQTAVYEKEIALYNLAVAVRVKILHDGDPKGDMSAVLTGIVGQARVGDA